MKLPEAAIVLMGVGAMAGVFFTRLGSFRAREVSRRLLAHFLSLGDEQQRVVLNRCDLGDAPSASERADAFAAFLRESWRELKKERREDPVAFEEQFSALLRSGRAC